MPLDSLIHFLEAHHSLVLVILFLGAFLETLIFTSVFIYGEFFFLAGAILAGMGQANLLAVAAVLYAGGILGDHASYWIGRFWGKQLFDYFQTWRLTRRYFTKNNFDLGNAFFHRFGGWAVFMGRFLGPVSWITPFLVGMFKLSYARFTFFNIPGVFLGIGQFILIGYFFGRNYQTILTVVNRYLLIGVFIFCCAGVAGYAFRRLLRRLHFTARHSLLYFFARLRSGNPAFLKQIGKVVSITLIGIFVFYCALLFMIFFITNQRLSGPILPDLDHTFTSVDEVVQSIDSTLYYENGTANVQPMNIVLIGSSSIDTFMQDAKWRHVNTFVRDHIKPLTYFSQATDGLFPISDLYFKKIPQDFAFEYVNSTLLDREHVRAWRLGTLNGMPAYALSVSRDTGIDIYRDLSFVVPFHGVDPNVDASRSFFVQTLLSAYPDITLETKPSKFGPVQNDPKKDLLYYTDGNIAVLQEK